MTGNVTYYDKYVSSQKCIFWQCDDISISDAETQSGNEHEPSDNVNDDVHVDAQPRNNNDVEIEPVVDLDNSE